MSDLVERLQSHMGLADMQEVLADCRLAASRISQQDAELERVRRELEELREISVDKARAWDALNATFERGRRKGLDEAASWHDGEAARYMRKVEQRKRATHEIAAAVMRAKAKETRT